ncbi:Amine oxidase OS=Streptomyces microflavus OX=1919 GN=Smic_73320 PE=4 SV=1 [Streptomyces microflavus]
MTDRTSRDPRRPRESMIIIGAGLGGAAGRGRRPRSARGRGARGGGTRTPTAAAHGRHR